jgi:hypothetical protein
MKWQQHLKNLLKSTEHEANDKNIWEGQASSLKALYVGLFYVYSRSLLRL